MLRDLKVIVLIIGVACLMSACDLWQSGSGQSNRKTVELHQKNLEYNRDIINGKLAAPKGFVPKNLFDERLNDNNDRFNRLEYAVQEMRDEIDVSAPAIKRLTAIEKDIQNLVKQLKTLVTTPPPPQTALQPPIDLQSHNATAKPGENSTPPPPPAQTTTTTPAPPKQTTKPPPATGNGSGIDNIRISDNGQKTRIVFDSRVPVTYQTNYDSQEKLILVTSNAGNIAIDPAIKAKKSRLIDDMTYTTDNNGTDIIIALNKNVSLSKQTVIKPSASNPNYRYYFDLFPN